MSLMQTWVALNFFENRYAHGWGWFFSSAVWGSTDPSTTGWMIGEPNETGVTWDVLGVRNTDHRVYQIRHEINTRGHTGVERIFKAESIPSWTRIASVPSIEDAQLGVHVIEQLNGWPFLAWRGEARWNSTGLVYRKCFPSTKSMGWAFWKSLVLFPYEPVFPGVLYNSLFFGGILFITVRIIKHTRRRITEAVRLSRHQCTKCKYDITGLTTCPECGQPVAAKA